MPGRFKITPGRIRVFRAYGGRIRVLRAYGGHETEPAVIAGFLLAPGTLSTGSLNNLNIPADVSRCGKGKRAFLHPANAFGQSLLSGQDASDRNPRRPWEPAAHPLAPSRTGSKVKTGNSPVRKGDRSGGGCAPSLPKAPAKCPQESPARIKSFQASPFIEKRCLQLQPPSSMGTARRLECCKTG